MDYKVLIKLYVPEIEESYEMYIPINKTIYEMGSLLSKVVNDISKVYPAKENASICNRRTGAIYEKRVLVRESDIRNGSELVLF